MDKLAHIEIKIEGFIGNLKLTPEYYDIRDIIALLQNVESMLFPNEKKDAQY